MRNALSSGVSSIATFAGRTFFSFFFSFGTVSSPFFRWRNRPKPLVLLVDCGVRGRDEEGDTGIIGGGGGETGSSRASVSISVGGWGGGVFCRMRRYPADIGPLRRPILHGVVLHKKARAIVVCIFSFGISEHHVVGVLLVNDSEVGWEVSQ